MVRAYLRLVVMFHDSAEDRVLAELGIQRKSLFRTRNDASTEQLCMSVRVSGPGSGNGKKNTQLGHSVGHDTRQQVCDERSSGHHERPEALSGWR